MLSDTNIRLSKCPIDENNKTLELISDQLLLKKFFQDLSSNFKEKIEI